MKKKCIIILFLTMAVMLTLALQGCNAKPSADAVYELQTGVIGSASPVTRAEAAKMLALYHFSQYEIESMDSCIKFNDVLPEMWYYKYINAAYAASLISGVSDNSFEPEAELTLIQAQYLIDRLSNKNNLKIKYDDTTKDKPISYALWVEIYLKLLENGGNKALIRQNTVITANGSLSSKIKNGFAATNKGILFFSGIDTNKYIDCELEILTRDKTVAALIEIKSLSPVLKNVYINSCGKSNVSIFTNGIEKTYRINDDIKNEAKSGCIADITINSGVITKITAYNEASPDIVRLVSDGRAELAEQGSLNTDPDMSIYSLYNNKIHISNDKNLISGKTYDFIISDGNIRACIEKSAANTIRVLINSTASPYHAQAVISSAAGFSLDYSDKHTDLAPNEQLTISAADFAGIYSNAVLRLTPNDGGTLLFGGSSGTEYSGILEIRNTENGLTAVNELNIEEYLISVLTARLPADCNDEYARLQAVIARTEALNAIAESKMNAYGANVSDKSTTLPYRGTKNKDAAAAAVTATAGKIIAYDSTPILPAYFAVSCGLTANDGDVWPDSVTKYYPHNGREYLKSIAVDPKNNMPTAETSEEFMLNSNFECYESKNPWFRWNFSMTYEELTAVINANIANVCQQYSTFVKVLDKNGIFIKKTVNNISSIKSIRTAAQGDGLNVRAIEIAADDIIIRVETDSAIKALIQPKQLLSAAPIKLNKNDGSFAENFEQLPSTFFIIKSSENSAAFYGGGFGHGVGLSTAAAQEMTAAGMSWQEITAAFYAGSTIQTIDIN